MDFASQTFTFTVNPHTTEISIPTQRVATAEGHRIHNDQVDNHHFYIVVFFVIQSWNLIVIVVMISIGLILFTYKSTQFNFLGFVLLLLASVSSGIRWTCIQLLLQKSKIGMRNPLDMIYYMQPWMIVSVVPFAIWIEGGDAIRNCQLLGFLHTSTFIRLSSKVLLGAFIAFFMEFSEVTVVTYTSGLTLGIAGIFKLRASSHDSDIFVNNLSKVELNEIQLRLEKIDPAVFQEYENIQESIEMIDFEESADRDLFENMYFQLISEVKTLLNLNDKAMLDGSNLDALSDVSSQHSHRSQCNPSNSLVRLPPIKLAVFDGHYQNWLEFKDTFSALLHNNESLSGIQKFYYLRSSLDKSVEQVIKNIEISERNYETAWAFLLSRCENKNLMIFNHLRQMFEFPVQKEESLIKLRNLYDTFSKHLRSLDTLGENTDTWDSPMIYLMASKFDPITKREWKMYKYKGEVPSLIDVNDLLKQKCEAFERLAVSKPENKFKFGKTKSHGFVSTNDQSNITCYYCKKGHKIYQCESFLKLSIDNRCAWVNNSNLCTLCLRDNYTALVCKARKCPRCQKTHNSVLCRVSSAGQTPNVNSNRSADDSGAVTAASAEVFLAGTDTEPRPIAMTVVSNEGNSFHCISHRLLHDSSLCY
nr:unnamed protein product [Callosobruchus analis]